MRYVIGMFLCFCAYLGFSMQQEQIPDVIDFNIIDTKEIAQAGILVFYQDQTTKDLILDDAEVLKDLIVPNNIYKFQYNFPTVDIKFDSFYKKQDRVQYF